MNKCKGICNRHKIPYQHSTYEFCKRCTKCSVWFLKNEIGVRCPCCSIILRIGKRSNVRNEKLKRIEA